MNDLLKKHFTEEEFNELKEGKLITQSYLEGGSYHMNSIKKSLGSKKVKSNYFTRYKREYPGCQLIRLEDNFKEVEDNITLSHVLNSNEHMWILKLKIDPSGWSSGVLPFETDYLTGWTRVSEGSYGVGDTYGELKPYSQSIENSKLVDNIRVGDVFIHLMNYHCLYISEVITPKQDGFTPNKFKCEQWGFNAFKQGNNDIIPTPVTMSSPIHYFQDIDMEELDILNMYSFFMKSKIGSTDLKDYFGCYGE